MPPFTEQDAALLQRINRHPLLRARVESLLGVVEDAEGDLEKADAAQAREEPGVRGGGKKNSTGTPPSA